MGSAEFIDRLVKKVRAPNPVIREFIAEFFGMYVLLVLGLGSVAMFVMHTGQQNFLAVSFAWGLAVAVAVWTCAGISKGHVNPAITLAMAVIGKIEWFKVPIYFLAQYLGAFLGAVSVYLIYYDALNNYDGGIRSVTGPNATADVFASYPKPYLSISGGFIDEMVGTQFLMMGVLAVTDGRNHGPERGMIPLCVGFVVTVVIATLGMNCGSPINPARDFAPRLFTAMAGWGSGVFSAGNYWFWVPVIAPHVGAIIGGLLYVTLITANLPEQPEDNEQTKKIQFDEVSQNDEAIELSPFNEKLSQLE